jgi:hypothetical protein
VHLQDPGRQRAARDRLDQVIGATEGRLDFGSRHAAFVRNQSAGQRQLSDRAWRRSSDPAPTLKEFRMSFSGAACTPLKRARAVPRVSFVRAARVKIRI